MENRYICLLDFWVGIFLDRFFLDFGRMFGGSRGYVSGRSRDLSIHFWVLFFKKYVDRIV